MTKTELVDAIAEETDLLKKDIKEVIDTTFDTIMDYLEKEAEKPEKERDNMQIIGFGKFEGELYRNIIL